MPSRASVGSCLLGRGGRQLLPVLGSRPSHPRTVAGVDGVPDRVDDSGLAKAIQDRQTGVQVVFQSDSYGLHGVSLTSLEDWSVL